MGTVNISQIPPYRGGGWDKNFHEIETQLNSPTRGIFRLQMSQKVAKSMTKITIQSLDSFRPGGYFSSTTRAIILETTKALVDI